MTSLTDIVVRHPDGEPVRLGELVDRPTVLVIPRYYGCLPCRDYLRQLAARNEEVQGLGAALVSVSVGAGFQARWLLEKYRIPFPLLIDPDRNLHQAVRLPRRWWITLNPRGWWYYIRAIFHGNRQGVPIEPNQQPGLALLDEHCNVAWIYRGNALGDYPKLDLVFERLAKLCA
jgi:hypothetical protein